MSIVNASVDGLTSSDRIRLVKPLLAEGQLEAAELTRGGSVVGMLLKEGLLQPSRDAYAARLLPTWEDWEAAIRARPNEFDEVLDPKLLPTSQVRSFLTSDVVPTSTKRRVVTDWHHYAPGAGHEAADVAGDLAHRHQWPLGSAALQALIDERITTARIMPLLGEANLTTTELRDLLRQTAKRYCDLSELGTDPVDVADMDGLVNLLERLNGMGIVSSFKTHPSKAGWLRVHRHRPKR